MSSVVAWRTLEGSTVDGKFPLRQWLGGSDHSAVFLTERMLLGVTGPQKAVIKLVAADSANSADQLSRWRTAAQLSHPHLIRIFDSGRCQLEGEQLLYMVTEFAEEDLSQILPHRPLTPGEAGDMLPPLFEALSYLHGKGFVHGHIRPSNVLAVGDQLKLSSDQIVSASNAAAEHRRRDAYDAPETAAGVVTPESDMWSVGATLVAALTQGSALPGETLLGDLALPKTIPEPFRGIARECLYLDPKRRSTIAEIMARLEPAGRSVPAEPVPAPIPPRRSSRAPVTIAILVIGLVVGLIVFFSRGKNGPPQSSSGTSEQSSQSSQPSTTPPAAPTISAQAPPASASPAPTPQAQTPKPTSPSTSQGEIVHRVVPDVPKSARNTITGKIKVTARVEVDASGKVTAAKLTSPGPSQYFARLALNAAQHWEFSPLQVNGQPAASAWALHFRFGRKGIEVSPEKLKR
jgi:TonB family protein